MSSLKRCTGTAVLVAAMVASMGVPASDEHHGHQMGKMASGEMATHPHSMHQGSMPGAMSHPIAVTGVIKAVVAADNAVKVHHGPIPAWQMGAMQMTFRLGPGIDISALKAGQQIDFLTMSPSPGRFVITEIR